MAGGFTYICCKSVKRDTRPKEKPPGGGFSIQIYDVDQAAINAGLASPASQVRRQAANRPPLLGSPSPIVQHVPMV